LRPKASDDQTVALAQWLVPVVMLVAVYFALTGNATIVAMLLVSYSFVTQLFPAVIASLMRAIRRSRRRLRRNSGWRGRRRRPQLHSCDHRLAVPRPAGSNPRPQRRYHRACRKYRRVGRRQRGEQAAHSLGGHHVKVGRRSATIGVLLRDDRR
jgi:hypothetical protein